MLIFAFLLSCFALILQGILLPKLSILAFAPFLALSILRKNLKEALKLAVLAGCMMDLVSSDPFGLHAINYTLISALFFRMKNHFLADEPFHLSIFTGFISASSSALQLTLLFLFDRRVPFDGKWILTDFLGMGLIDAFFAFIWFAAPLALVYKLNGMWKLFWLKRKNRTQTSP